MAIKRIVKYPDPVLRKKTKQVTEFGEDLQKLIEDMADTMYDAPGVGLAANQIGENQQVVVIDITPQEEEKQLLVLVNPEILDKEGEQIGEEGCLSVLELSAKVKRYKKVCIKAQDIDGKPIQMDAEDLLARVIQHELDHLHGKLFVDHISTLKRSFYKKKLKKILQEQQGEDVENKST